MLDKEVATYSSCGVVVGKDAGGLVQQLNNKHDIDCCKKCLRCRSRIVCWIIIMCLLGFVALAAWYFNNNNMERHTSIFSRVYCGDPPEPNCNCFDADSIVYRYVNDNGTNINSFKSVLLRDIKENDLIMSDLHGGFSKVLLGMYYDDDDDEVIPMTKLCVDDKHNNNNSCLIIGNNHLLFVNGITLDDIIPAKDVKIGDYLYGSRTHVNGIIGINNINISSKELVVKEIERNVYKERRHPILESGTIIVNDIFASCHNGLTKEDHVLWQKMIKSGDIKDIKTFN